MARCFHHHRRIHLVLGLLLASSAHAIHSPSRSSVLKTSSCSVSDEKLFGVVHRIPAIQIRGGEVHEPADADAVDSLILKAGASGQLVVIDFSATWCGPCKMIAPLFQQLSESTSGVTFIKIDVDENPETAAKYNVSAMPTFVFIKGGEVVDRLMGANPDRLQELIGELK